MTLRRPGPLAAIAAIVALAAATAVTARAGDELAPLPSPLRLEDATALARAGRAEIDAARARADAAAARPRIVSALEEPMVIASVDHLPFALHGVDASLVVEQRFPLSRVRRHRADVARADARRLAADVDRVALDVEAEAARAFVMLREERAMAAILGEQRALAEQLVRAATARYAGGKGMQADVMRAELGVVRITAELDARVAGVRAAEAMLNTSLGRPADAPVPALADDADEEPPPAAELARAALDRRPELRVGRAEVERAKADVAVMKDMYRPMAMVQTGPAYTMSDGAGWMLMVGVSLPIWRGKLAAGVDEARAMTRMAERDLSAMRTMIAGDTAAARERVVAAGGRWRALRDQVLPRAQAAIEPMVAAYVGGDMPLVSVIEMIDMATMTRMELAAAERDLGLARAALARAVAAGR
jgi:outer membrane protein TolC